MIVHGERSDPKNNAADFIIREILWVFKFFFWFIVIGVFLATLCICPPVGLCIMIAVCAYWLADWEKE